MKKPSLILMVDDDADDHFLFADALNVIDPRIKLDTAFDGVAALNYLCNSTLLPGFIFIDLNMPRMDGRECLAEIKKTKRLESIPVIVYSNASTSEEEKKLKELGATLFLQKPVDQHVMRFMISFIISGDYLTKDINDYI